MTPVAGVLAAVFFSAAARPAFRKASSRSRVDAIVLRRTARFDRLPGPQVRLERLL